MARDPLFLAYLAERKALVDEALNRLIPGEENDPPIIFQAIRYSLFAGGKRIRPILCLAGAEAVGGTAEEVLTVACALECIHTYSLIHDDLPAMDNDDFRRGRPTSHKVFGDGMAVLAGDALLTEAFSLLASAGQQTGTDPRKMLAVIRHIARAAGIWGMVGGQVLDIQSEGKAIDMEVLQDLHARKTGAMIQVSVTSGAFLAGGHEEQIAALADYGRRLGLAFQIADDILNVTGDAARMGKNTGSDLYRGKVTFPTLMGLEGSRQKLAELVDLAINDLACFGDQAAPLRRLAEYMRERDF